MALLDNFDFVCISLKHRSDRRHQIKEVFHKLGIRDRINWWIVEKHPTAGMHGCFESHYNVWSSLDFKRPYLCIFEDDIRDIGKGSHEFYDCLRISLEYLPQRADILNLEPKLGYVEEHLKDNIYRGFFLHLGCYIVSRSSLPTILTQTGKLYGMDIDTALYKNCRMLGIFPQILIQGDATSDNSGFHRNLSIHLPKFSSLSQEIQQLMGLMPIIGWLSMEWMYMGSLYLIMNSPVPEFKNRRI